MEDRDPKGKAKLAFAAASGGGADDGSSAAAVVDESMETCGICLSDDGRSVRGWIDSCNHYYCFVCIIEWAKVESRCPMCKLRFQSICRPPVRGLFPRERLVHVRLRDQVYHPLGNESTGLSAPYEHVICSECHTSADEELLLLCDLCDSAAHTYCVGLGPTVPEGDWFCPDCTISRDEHSKVQSDADYHDQDAYKKLSIVQKVNSSVSILEIVTDGDAFDSSLRLTNSRTLEERSYDSHPSGTTAAHSETQDPVERFSCPAARVNGVSSPSQETIAEQGARTLHHCRNLHDRIRIIRENWHALRAGSLYFSSSLLCNVGATGDKKESAGGMSNGKSRQINSSSSGNSEQTALVASTSSQTPRKTATQDVDKAWKMMKVAKSLQGAQNDKISGHSVDTSRRSVVSKQTEALCSSASMRKGDNSMCRFLSAPESLQSYQVSSAGEKHRPRSLKRHRSDKQTKRLMQNVDGEPLRNTSLLECPAKEDKSLRYMFLDKDLEDDWPKASTLAKGTRPDVPSDADTYGSLPGASNLSFSKMISDDSHFCNSGTIGADTFPGESRMGRNEKRGDNSKADVQSLVKLNLKLLSRDSHLGADRFKEVARIATHTILAACGLEHSKSTAREFPGSICRHTEQVKQLHRSNLMPSSCRKCFFAFVENVVNSVLCERKHFYQVHI